MAPVRRPKLDGFTDQIDQWLLEDKSQHRKQGHTAKRVFDRLKDECGFKGGYTIVKDYIREKKQGGREMFVPLSHKPGHAQADFGEARAIIAGVEQKVFFFALDLPHSDACYIRAYHRANTEAWLEGHVHAFAFFGAVPHSIVYDNDRCLVAKIMPKAFTILQRILERRSGTTGKREYVQVLRLLERFDMAILHEAIKDALLRRATSFDAIRHLVLCRASNRSCAVTDTAPQPVPELLLASHLKTLRLPTFLREYEKMRGNAPVRI